MNHRKTVLLLVPILLLFIVGGLWFWRGYSKDLEPWWVASSPATVRLRDLASDLVIPLALPTWIGDMEPSSVRLFGMPGEGIAIVFRARDMSRTPEQSVHYIQSARNVTSGTKWVGEVKRQTVNIQGVAATLESGETSSTTAIIPLQGGRYQHEPLSPVPTVRLTWQREGVTYALEGQNVPSELVIRMAQSIRGINDTDLRD